MSATPELTTRDVLQQVDRRLPHLEELTLQHELRNDQAHSAMNERNDRAHASLDMKIDRNLRWTITRLLGSWMTTMSAIS